MEMLLHGEGYDKIREYVRGVLKTYLAGKYPLDEAGIPGGFSKSLEEYDHADAHVRGAKYSNKYLKTTFGKASKPKRVYIKKVNGNYEKTDVICFEYGDQVPAEFVVNWEVMLEKTLQKPLERIFEALDWDWVDFDPLRTTLSQWGFD
jgi:DNA polymerase I